MAHDLGFWTLQALNALQLSMLLFLLSIGLTVIFGLMHFVNLAHGSLYALGAYFAASLAAVGGYWVGFFLAPVAVAGVGVLLYSGLIKRMRKSGPMAQVLVTFGLIFVMLDLTRIFWGDLALGIEVPALLEGRLAFFGIEYPTYRLFIIALGLAIFAVFLCQHRAQGCRRLIGIEEMAETISLLVFAGGVVGVGQTGHENNACILAQGLHSHRDTR